MLFCRSFASTCTGFFARLAGKNLGRLCLLLALAPLMLRAANAPTGLLCNLLEHPEETVITTVAPKFGWIYNPSFRNDSQPGYRIIVASSQTLAGQGTGDLWDSGMVSNTASINVPYAGSSLQPNTSYFWRVQTLDSAGQLSAFSVSQQFNTDTQLSNPLTNTGVIYNSSTNLWANRYPLRFVAAAPVLVMNTASKRWFIDFGQDAFSYVTVHLNGSFSGTNVQARFGEMASGNAVNTAPSGTVRYGTSTFTLQNGDVIYEVRPPSNSGHTIDPPSSFGVVLPFRYFELTNFPGTITTNDVVQQRLVYEFNTNAASFNSSSAALNQVWNLCRNSMEWLSFDGIYVDGDRERKPYEADAYIQQMSSYAVDLEFTMARYSQEYLLVNPTWPFEWKFHSIFMAWADYLQTGNADLLYNHYDTLKTKLFLSRARADGLIKGYPHNNQNGNDDIVDWPTTDRDGYVIYTGSYSNYYSSVNNAFYYRCLQIMANVATVIGQTNDAATFTTNASQVYNSYNTVLWSSASQSYIDGEGTTHSAAHANFFPLAFGLVPTSNQTAVVNYLHSRIAANNGMPPSVYGAQYLLEALFQSGDADTALGLMTTNGPRSWLNMINIGSTLTDEAWSFADKSNEDWNHAWGAAAGNIIPRFVLGLRPLEAGYGRILIQPQPGQTLSYVQGVIPTIRGPVSIQVTNGINTYQMLLNLPGNVTATVMLPSTNTTALVDGAVVSGTVSNNWLTVTNIGSGQHAVWLNTNATPTITTLYNNWAAGWFGTNASNASLAGQTADADGDGLNNFNEFIAGTNPLDATDWFHIIKPEYASAGPVMTVTVAGKAGRHYTLQHTLTLSPISWVTADTQSATADNQTVILHDSSLSGSTQAFLRVMVLYP